MDVLSPLKSCYELLGVPQSADAIAIHKAFRSLSKTLHPDTTSLPAEEAVRRFQQVSEAYELLSDPNRREAYDLNLNGVNTHQKNNLSQPLDVNNGFYNSGRLLEVRRSLSGGELFSLMMLGLALFMSLILAIGFAFTQGRELQSRPSWLIVEQSTDNVIATIQSNDYFASSSNAFESALFNSFRTLAK